MGGPFRSLHSVGRFYIHAAGHFHVQSMAEPVAVVPEHTRLVGNKGDRGGLLRADLHADTMVNHTEAMGDVFDHIQVGDKYSHLVALVHLELGQVEGRSRRSHVDTNLLAIPDDLVVAHQVDAILFGNGTGSSKVWVVAVPNLAGLDLITACQDAVMRLGKRRAIVNQLHFFTGNIDQLIVFGVQWANRQEAVLGELAQHHQPLAVRLAGLGQGGMVVARLVMNVQLLLDVIGFLAVVEADGFFDVPLHHLAVDEQGGVGVATTVKGGVQRPKTQLWLTDNYITLVFVLVVKQVIQTINGNDRAGWRQLAVGNEVLAVW